MSAENQTQDFEKLQRLLKLKRHEPPPPRFFNDFSGKVTDRIRAGDVGRMGSLEDVVAQAPWLQRIWRVIEGRPAISGMFAAGVCGLVLAGVFLPGQVAMPLPTIADNEKKPEASAPAALFANSPLGATTLASSTNPSVVLPGNSLFNTMPNIQSIPASGLPMQLAPK